MPFNDLREFIAKCKQLGEVQVIDKEVDWNLEAGAITRRCCELSAPAPFFKKVKDYPEGYTIFGGPLATFKRLAIAMDIDPDSSYREIMNAYIERSEKRVKPRLVKEGPCKENIITGDAIDLYNFPAPYVHEGDGGRYLGTFHIIAAKDPDNGWVNWGMYRLMIHTKNTLGGLVAPAQHIGMIFRNKYEARNKPMEFAVAIGTEPITAFIGGAGVPAYVNEADVIGGMRGEPLDVVKCETVDLEVPATSEIIIEGVMKPHDRKVEGPFGEYGGYRAIPSLARPVYTVTAVTHRNNPILTMSNMGIATDDADVIQGLTMATEIYVTLKKMGFPITGVHVPPEGCCSTAIISTKIPYANIASRIAAGVWASAVGHFVVKIIIVDDNVDPYNMKEVFHAWGTKCHPVRGTTVIPQAVMTPAYPYYSPEETKYNLGCNVYYDCTYPFRWPKEHKAIRSSFAETYPKELQQKVLDNWSAYGFKA
ncbi:MAG: UbiD family decarboxylase [Syntrophorhabdales bacterium]|jgi:4-hydroxy-3-polyprenylbenzoate decarboxylase